MENNVSTVSAHAEGVKYQNFTSHIIALTGKNLDEIMDMKNPDLYSLFQSHYGEWDNLIRDIQIDISTLDISDDEVFLIGAFLGLVGDMLLVKGRNEGLHQIRKEFITDASMYGEYEPDKRNAGGYIHIAETKKHTVLVRQWNNIVNTMNTDRVVQRGRKVHARFLDAMPKDSVSIIFNPSLSPPAVHLHHQPLVTG